MIAVDTNLLVYAHREDAEWHSEALTVLSKLADGAGRWAIPWPCVHEFLGIVTHPRIYATPLSVHNALATVGEWMKSPSLSLLAETPSYWPRLEILVAQAKIRGPKIHDARIAALCVTHGVRELWTTDRDFSRFRGLRTVNPLVR